MKFYIFLCAAVLWLVLSAVAWRTTGSRSLAVWNAGCIIWVLATALVLRPELLPSYLSGPAVVVLSSGAAALFVGGWRIGKSEAARQLQAEDARPAVAEAPPVGVMGRLAARWKARR